MRQQQQQQQRTDKYNYTFSGINVFACRDMTERHHHQQKHNAKLLLVFSTVMIGIVTTTQAETTRTTHVSFINQQPSFSSYCSTYFWNGMKKPTRTTDKLNARSRSRKNIKSIRTNSKNIQQLSIICFGVGPEGDENRNNSDTSRRLQFEKNNQPSSSDDVKVPINNSNTPTFVQEIISRFSSPIIDDPYLPISDAASAQIIAPTLQLLWIVLSNGPRPSWCNPYFSTTTTTTLFGSTTGAGSLIAPTLIHGAALASCWILGAIAAQAYKRESISPKKVILDPTTGTELSIQATDDQFTKLTLDPSVPAIRWDYSKVFVSLFQAGSFAIGILILATQLDLLIEYKGQYVQFGMNEETDLRLLIAIVELINDIVFEMIVLVGFRLALAYQTQRQGSSNV